MKTLEVRFDLAVSEKPFIQTSIRVARIEDVPEELAAFLAVNTEGEVWILDVPLSNLI